MPTIKIESILGGQGPASHFAAKDQFRASLGIDPAQPVDDSAPGSAAAKFSLIASGLLRPAPTQKTSGAVIANAPQWMVNNPKDDNVYVYDITGSAYSVSALSGAATALSDGGALTGSIGNGCEYYDNYIYFAKNTDIARYGPLNGVPTFTGSYWVGTLGKAALNNTSYPAEFFATIPYPNHVMHRHSDGNLYIADVSGNQGVLHFISTKKTAVEGDTDNGSTASKLTFGFGLWPTALESYNGNLVIALVEATMGFTTTPKIKAKIGFWDTTSQNANQITWLEFPDQIITGMINKDGVLYVASGNIQKTGCRISQYVGGYTFKTVAYIEDGEPPFHSAMAATAERLLFGSFCEVPETGACIYSLGLQKDALSQGLFNVMNGSNSQATVSALCMLSNDLNFDSPLMGWTTGEAGSGNNGIDVQGSTYNNARSVWWSQLYRIGQRFRIIGLSIPFIQQIAAGHRLVATFYTDNGNNSYVQQEINSTNFPNSDQFADINIANVMGFDNFWLELAWLGSAVLTVSLPITIEYETIAKSL